MALLTGDPFWRFPFRHTFIALRHRNYRIWFAGQLVSLLGSWMQITAQGFLVYELTRSPAYLGMVAFAAGLPSWMFMLWAGVIADRVSRRRLMLVTQSAMMSLAAVLAALTFLGLVQAWHIVVLAFLLGVANAFDAPARQAFVMQMVDREDVTNAVALNSMMFNTATALGPAVAGIVYAGIGPQWCFTANALSFVAVIASLFFIRPRQPMGAARVRASAWADLREGLRFVATDRSVRTLIGLVMVLSTFGISAVTLMPAWAVKILGGDATTNGFLQSARGVGALLGALTVATLGRSGLRGRLLTASSIAFPLTLLLFCGLRTEALAILAVVLVGATMVVTLNLVNSLVQTISPESMTGRVMAIYSLSFFGFMPLGAVLVGVLAEHIGEPPAVVIGACIVLAFTAGTALLVPSVRRLA